MWSTVWFLLALEQLLVLDEQLLVLDEQLLVLDEQLLVLDQLQLVLRPVETPLHESSLLKINVCTSLSGSRHKSSCPGYVLQVTAGWLRTCLSVAAEVPSPRSHRGFWLGLVSNITDWSWAETVCHSCLAPKTIISVLSLFNWRKLCSVPLLSVCMGL